jgi:hypothetical protein
MTGAAGAGSVLVLLSVLQHTKWGFVGLLSAG